MPGTEGPAAPAAEGGGPELPPLLTPRGLGCVFALLLVATIAMLFLGLSWTRCHGGDAAGCGLSKGFAALGSWAMISVALVAGLLHLFRNGVARSVAWLTLTGVAVLATLGLAQTVQRNRQVTGRADGLDPARLERRPDEALRRAVRCFLAASVRRAEDADAARAFDELSHFYQGQLWLLKADIGESDLARIAREEGAELRAEGEPYDAIAECADRQSGMNDARRLLLDGAGLDAGELERRREAARGTVVSGTAQSRGAPPADDTDGAPDRRRGGSSTAAPPARQ